MPRGASATFVAAVERSCRRLLEAELVHRREWRSLRSPKLIAQGGTYAHGLCATVPGFSPKWGNCRFAEASVKPFTTLVQTLKLGM